MSRWVLLFFLERLILHFSATLPKIFRYAEEASLSDEENNLSSIFLCFDQNEPKMLIVHWRGSPYPVTLMSELARWSSRVSSTLRSANVTC